MIFFLFALWNTIGIGATPYLPNNYHMDQGIDFYEKRAETVTHLTADPEYIDKAIYHFEQALSKDANNLSAVVYLLKAFDFKGAYTGLSEKSQVAVFQKGIDLAYRYLEKYPNHSVIKYWYLSHLGRWAHKAGALTAARANIGQKMRDLCHELIEENPSYNEAGPYRILGVMHVNVPHIPLLLTWPSKKKGLALLQKALELDPGSFANHYEYAKALIQKEKKAQAIEILRQATQKSPDPKRSLEDKVILHQIRNLLAELE